MEGGGREERGLLLLLLLLRRRRRRRRKRRKRGGWGRVWGGGAFHSEALTGRLLQAPKALSSRKPRQHAPQPQQKQRAQLWVLPLRQRQPQSL